MITALVKWISLCTCNLEL